MLRQIAKLIVVFPIYHFACFFHIMLDHTKLHVRNKLSVNSPQLWLKEDGG